MQTFTEVETAGRLAIHNVPIVTASDPIATAREGIQSGRHDVIDLVIVIDRDGRFRGVVELKELLQARSDESVDSLAREDWPTVAPDADQEHAADIATRSGVAALPVVTSDKRPLGLIPARILLDVLAREHREDVHRFAGILRERAGSVHALEDPPLRRTARRLPWLLIGLVMSAGATGVMAGFERTLEKNVTIAFFIPALVYLADAVGTQTKMIAVRGLSLQRMNLGRLFGGEIATGGLIGFALGAIAFVSVWAVFGSVILAIGVGVSLLAAGTLASAMGLLLPWMLSRLNVDPAFGSGPVATIIQDVMTIVIYFVVMTSLLKL